MNVEGERPSIPSAPDALRRAVVDNERTGEYHHTETATYVNGLIQPLLQALSVPESYSRSTTKLDGIPQEDLWRRSLDYSVQVTLPQQPDFPYFIHATQIIEEDGDIRQTILEATTHAPDEIRIASIGREGISGGILLVRNSRREIAQKKELDEIKDLAKFLSEEAPRQAIAKSNISPHWMERWDIQGAFISKTPLKEGFPSNPLANNKPNLYEIIYGNGERRIATVDNLGGENVWRDDIVPEMWSTEREIAAWRRVRNMLPDYYRKLKYPSIYFDKGPVPTDV